MGRRNAFPSNCDKEERHMTEEQKSQIKAFRNNGLGYKLIAKELGISVNSVKSFCRRNELCDTSKDETPRCEQCGKALQNIPGKKKKRFCSDRCRQTWWNSHLDIVKRKAVYVYICPVCRKEFSVYGNAKRKYCSHQCYVEGRYGGAGNE